MGKTNPNSRRTKRHIQIICGSTPKTIVATEDRLNAGMRGDAPSLTLRLLFDHKEAPPADLAPPTTVYRAPNRQSFVQAAKPTDTAALRKAQDQGLVVIPPEDWGRPSHGVRDNEGAGGSPREGEETAQVNGHKLTEYLNRCFQQVIAYEERIGNIGKGHDLGQEIGRVPVHIVVATVGGTGNGALIWFITRCIMQCARRNGVEPRIVVELLCLGNLQTHDTETARRNEWTLLRSLRVLASGTCVDTLTGEVQPVPFEHPRLYANINNGGNLTSLKALTSHQAHLFHLLWNTPAGGDLREREQDIAAWDYDSLDDPRCGFTGGTAAIHLNRERLLNACAHQTASQFIRSLLTEGDSNRMLAEATALAGACNLIESEDQSQLTSLVSRPEELAGETVYVRTERSLADRTSGTQGHQRAILRQETIHSIRTHDIPSVLEPLARTKAQATVRADQETLAKALDQILRRPSGLGEAVKLLQYLLLILERSQQAIAAKASELQEYLAPHEAVLAEIAERLQQLSQQNRVLRAMRFQMVRSIDGALAQSGHAAISYQLQIAVCHIAIQDVLMPLSDLLHRKLARLVACRQKLADVAQHVEAMAQSVVREPNVFDVPVGIELVDATYITVWWSDHIAQRGGPESLITALRGTFLQQHESFAALMDISFQEMEQALVALCRSVFEPAVAAMNVLTEWLKVHPDERTRQRLVAELIRQCEGRLLIEGEVNQAAAWIKTANVPAAEYVEPMRQLLEQTDTKAGKWQVAVDPDDPETFSMAQLRGDLSLTPFINRLDLPDTYESWRQIVATAADPVSALIVGPNPSARQLRRVLAKAIAAGLLTVEEQGCFVFRSAAGDQWLLGKTVEAVYEKLQPRWRQLVYAESFFASELVDSERQLFEILERMRDQLQAQDQPSDKLPRLIDAAAIDECLQQASLLRPWARKMQKARRRIAS